ncbi:MAG TPA: carboxypeptidase-like regulatory domain-containing protein [Blastocatellia bacterium]|nr:carboxypeptidase-like regulatory domain-containing protein [Blastocatellia bacterium]
MKRLFTIALVVLCLVPASIAAQQKGTLKGKIENQKGKPIAGAQVRVLRSRDRSSKETTTDEAGIYSFELAPDDYSVSFDAEGFKGGTMVQMQQVEEGKETTVKTIRLEKTKTRTSLIRGAVFDIDGRSLSGAKVKLVRVATADEEKDNKSVDSFKLDYTTNSKGEFAFRVPARRARYQVTASLAGYKPETKVAEVHEDEAVPLAFSLAPSTGKKQ